MVVFQNFQGYGDLGMDKSKSSKKVPPKRSVFFLENLLPKITQAVLTKQHRTSYIPNKKYLPVNIVNRNIYIYILF